MHLRNMPRVPHAGGSSQWIAAIQPRLKGPDSLGERLGGGRKLLPRTCRIEGDLRMGIELVELGNEHRLRRGGPLGGPMLWQAMVTEHDVLEDPQRFAGTARYNSLGRANR